MGIVLALLPWILFGALCAAKLREPHALSRREGRVGGPMVSIIVPARNEAQNIGPCVDSLAASEYGAFEIIVVDDRSEDGTAQIVRSTSARNAAQLRVISGEPLPDGWFGKPWACAQGARVARGQLLLFTDADTTHGPNLLGQAVDELQTSGASMVSLVGDQIMDSFWERVIQPQVFVMIALRYPNPRRLYEQPLDDPARWPHAIANGQYILVRRTAYESVGGHEAVRGEVVEDLRLAQRFVQEGRGLVLREARGRFATRMYRSLAGLIEGWSKNMWTGSRQSVPGAWGVALLPIGVLSLLGLWVLPWIVLAAALVGLVSNAVLVWAVLSTAIGILFWSVASARLGAPWYYGFMAPVGTAMTVGILLKSAWGGSRIEWKGRHYGRA